MGKQPPKMTALVVSAIRNLREIQGSTPKEILNYIMSEYTAPNPTNDTAVERKLCMALKRGLEYGILKCVHGHYSLNTDPETITPTEDMLMGPMERGSRGCGGAMKKKRRRRRARAGGRKGCKPRSGRARKRGGGGRKRRRAAKRGKCGPARRKSGGRSRRSRKSKGGRRGRRRGHKRAGGRRSRRGKSKCALRRTGEDVDVLAKDPAETRHRENIGGGYTYDRERERSRSRGRQSRSHSRSPSHSRSSGSSDREGNEGNRRDRQVE